MRELKLSDAERQRRRDHMSKLNADPVFAAERQKYASRRMREIHAAAREVMAKKVA